MYQISIYDRMPDFISGANESQSTIHTNPTPFPTTTTTTIATKYDHYSTSSTLTFDDDTIIEDIIGDIVDSFLALDTNQKIISSLIMCFIIIKMVLCCCYVVESIISFNVNRFETLILFYHVWKIFNCKLEDLVKVRLLLIQYGVANVDDAMDVALALGLLVVFDDPAMNDLFVEYYDSTKTIVGVWREIQTNFVV